MIKTHLKKLHLLLYHNKRQFVQVSTTLHLKKKGKKFNSLKCEQYDNGFMSLTSTNRKQGTMELLLFTPGFSSDAIPLSVSVDVPLSASLSIYLKERGQVRLVHCPTRGHVQSVRLSGIQSGQMSLG